MKAETYISIGLVAADLLCDRLADSTRPERVAELKATLAERGIDTEGDTCLIPTILRRIETAAMQAAFAEADSFFGAKK